MRQSLSLLLLTLIAVSCTAPSDKFRLEGKFKNFNQGALYIYNLDYNRSHKDTIQVFNGKFVYETTVSDSAAFAIIFPNFSEIPVYARPGVVAKLEGDASHLKAVEISGSKENELMTQFRLSIVEQTPPQVLQSVAGFVKEHPQSMLCQYLVDKHFVQRTDPDYKKAFELVDVMLKANPANDRLRQYRQWLMQLGAAAEKSPLPTFAAVTTKGQRVSNANLKAAVNVVYVWASWNYETLSMQRQLKTLSREYGSRLSVVGISLDASLTDCRNAMDRDSISWPVVCDGQMWQSPVVSQLGIGEIPSNYLVDGAGRIIARNLSIGELRERIKKALQ